MPSTPPKTRTREVSDLAALTRALWEVHVQDGYPMVWPGDPAAWLSPTGLAAAWVAVETDTQQPRVLGHVGVVTSSGTPLASVTRLFVAPAARGRNLRLGAGLLKAATQWAQKNGHRLILDVVDDGGPAIALYERLGWQLIDRQTTDWKTPDGRRLPLRIYQAPDQFEAGGSQGLT